ncbi:hypothetical protein OSB04_025129 [Centaurea solstitialis]|uniref:Replication protein A 70 kDa DNA-binding subunit B/D first OB fold domain-containing protein n=1 Tax=Centaurea solstitialis TaxID=347529 RepID=A0AA38W1E8_9ASTR|nr:hypothetical protein OSB04_025129 [Centaurea solstitialis]
METSNSHEVLMGDHRIAKVQGKRSVELSFEKKIDIVVFNYVLSVNILVFILKVIDYGVNRANLVYFSQFQVILEQRDYSQSHGSSGTSTEKDLRRYNINSTRFDYVIIQVGVVDFSTIDEKNITLIDNLDIQKDVFTVKIIIIRLWSQPLFKDPEQLYSIEMILMDEEGSKIHANVLQKWILKFKKLLHEGAVIFIKNPTIVRHVSNTS